MIDTRFATALARALGATPRNPGAGLTTAQLLPGLAAPCLGIATGLLLYQLAGGDLSTATPPAWWLLCVIPVTLIAIATATILPASLGARSKRPLHRWDHGTTLRPAQTVPRLEPQTARQDETREASTGGHAHSRSTPSGFRRRPCDCPGPPRWTQIDFSFDTGVMVDHEITEADPQADDVRELIARHLRLTQAVTPAEFAFALNDDELVEPGITFFGLRGHGQLLAIGALKYVEADHVELKSMHTAETARGRGLGRKMLDHLLSTARSAGCQRVSIETGSSDDFAPARALYATAGFVPCGPFGEYSASDWNTFMTLDLRETEDR